MNSSRFPQAPSVYLPTLIKFLFSTEVFEDTKTDVGTFFFLLEKTQFHVWHLWAQIFHPLVDQLYFNTIFKKLIICWNGNILAINLNIIKF